MYFTGEIPNRYYFHVKKRISNATGVTLECDVYRTTAASIEQNPRVEHVADNVRVLFNQDENDESFAYRVGRNQTVVTSRNKIEFLELQHREQTNPAHNEMDAIELAVLSNEQSRRHIAKSARTQTLDQRLARGALDATYVSSDEDNLLLLSSSDDDDGDDGNDGNDDVRGGEVKENEVEDKKRGPPDGAAAGDAKRRKVAKSPLFNDLFAGLRF